MKKLARSRENRIVAGVCSGLGEYLEIDPTVIRVIWAILTIMSIGVGVLAYLAAWVIMPEEETIEQEQQRNLPAPPEEE
jgi:phage shock protein PspC (stress-responsive transcriptional regulator)